MCILRDCTIEVFDHGPVDERCIERARHTRDIEDARERKRRFAALDVRREWRQDRNLVREAGEIDEVSLGKKLAYACAVAEEMRLPG